MTEHLSAVILAGGQSRRMGSDKALLEHAGETLLARTVRTVSELTDDVLVVGRTVLPPDCPPARTIEDTQPGMGPLAGLCTGLQQVSASGVLCVSCDLPFLEADALAILAGLLEGWDAVVPVVGGREQFLHAAYRRDIAPHLENRIAAGELSLHAGLRGLRVRRVAEEELCALACPLESMRNVNTPAEWQAIGHSLFA